MNKKLFILLVIIVAVLLSSGCVKKERQIPPVSTPTSTPVTSPTPTPTTSPTSTLTPTTTPTPTTTSTPSNEENGQTPSVSTPTPTDNQALYNNYEKECLQKGWQKVTINVDGLPRRILWKGPEQAWTNGAIIALHGGGGTYSNYCANIELGKPMIDFSELAISQGFAVISLESEDGFLRDTKGYSCGKRWLSMEVDKPNPDLLFIEKVITEVIPGLRPANSAKDIFITGISNGGFMTVLAATHFGDKISAFAPVSAGDPYGTYVDCAEVPLRDTPGKFIDIETNKPVNEKNACKADSYPHEKQWTIVGSQTPFKLFYHEGDAVVDTSCKEKVQRLLVEHGYKDEGSFVTKNVGIKRIINHFWREEYNQPLIEFFTGYANKNQ